MANSILLNSATISGTYNGEEVEFSTPENQVTIVNDVEAAKISSRTTWIGGVLTYTITITNDSGIDILDGVFKDVLDITQITLVPDSVAINGVDTPYTYDIDGTLTIPNLVISDTPVVVTFDVKRVTQEVN